MSSHSPRVESVGRVLGRVLGSLRVESDAELGLVSKLRSDRRVLGFLSVYGLLVRESAEGKHG